MKTRYTLLISLLVITMFTACEEYLDVKPEQSLVVPSTFEDVRLLLDNTVVLSKQPVLTLHSGDEFFLSEEVLNTLSASEQGAYQWLDDPFQGEESYDWQNAYEQVFYTNVALEALNKMESEEDPQYSALRGEALFKRAHAYYHLLQQFAPPYQLSGGNGQLPGIVLKESPDVNEKAVRSSLEESYNKVLEDLTEAVSLLPDFQLPKTRPGKAAALGMLARVHLSRFKYKEAAEAAEQALGFYPDRLDFNAIDVDASLPFERFGDETVYHSEMLTMRIVYSADVYVDTTLIAKYGEGDLRLSAYFAQITPGRYEEKGKLTGSRNSFGGLSTGELELIAAEGLARTGKEEEAREYLKALLSRRIAYGFFTGVEETGPALLGRILVERRKELFGRGLRWIDLRRLNQYPETADTLKKIVGGEVVELIPNSAKYVFPIPDEEIIFTGLRQNDR